MDAPRPAAAPAGFSAESTFKGVLWHQRWEMFDGVTVPGRNDVATLCDAVKLPADLTGKRVLDVGAWNGCFSFECERRGAREVVAMSLEDPEETGFNRLKHALDSDVQYLTGSVYTLSPEQLGTFDVVLFLGVLYHLRYPLLAIDRLRGVSAGDVYVETHVVDNHKWLRGPWAKLTQLVGGSTLRATPLWRQYREFELHKDDQSNWFGPNVSAVVEAFDSAGFKTSHTGSWQSRAGFLAKACPIPERLLGHTYEGCDANTAVVGLESCAAS
ncbi:tRNA (mo5U34)-methyltransferase [Pirellulimonas nuda]|uniref:tRNA (Mo5U34)-methyltransferase n=1 Tax=Pirellulimonas nuda TaxID=2528009 RepID=A0A518D7T4_9BACT|nr:DUF1698 domain-containing protein [Pirellulimonas nuda]QDU87537.1 tRNA (mo5U34)-methyltransferase [Pirellulimonas nuda]